MKWILKIYLLLVLAISQGCGVRGDPIPPQASPHISRGGPSFSGAGDEIESQNKDKETREKKK